MKKSLLLLTPPYHCGVVEVAGRWVPLSLLYIAQSAKRAGLDVFLFDAMSSFKDFRSIKNEIKRIKPDFIGITSITATINASIKICKIAKEVDKNIKTILGCVHPTFMDEEVLLQNRGYVDYIVRGEGEETTYQLFKTIIQKKDLHNVDGISFIDEDNNFIRTPNRRFLIDLEEYKPDYSVADFSIYKYFVIPNSTLGAISSSRGCNHSCSFCSQQKFWERGWRGRNPKDLVEEIKFLNDKLNVNVFLFTDEYPTKEKERWEEILDRIIHLKRDIYLLMETRAEDIVRDEKILPKYRKAGVVHIYVGLESSEQETLNLIDKELTIDVSKTSLELIRKNGMLSETSFVLGFLNETEESIKKTLDSAMKFNPDMAHFLFITPWPYSEIYNELKGRIKTFNYSKYNLIEPIVEPYKISRKQLDIAILNCYKDFYINKFKKLNEYKDEFQKNYMLTSMKLIMKSSFLKKKIAKLSFPIGDYLK